MAVPWLRAGSDFFVDAFRELPRDKRHDAYFAFEGALETYADQLAASPVRRRLEQATLRRLAVQRVA